jgi:type I restriction enzyme, S subunit
MSNLPKNWTTRKIRDICIMVSRGKTPLYGAGDFYAVKSAQVYDPLRLEDCPTVTEEFALRNKKFTLVKDDVLLNGTGTGTLGRSGYVYSDLNKIYIPDSHINLIRTDKSVAFGYFVFLWLNSSQGQDLINKSFSGSTNQIELSASSVGNFEIPLPPLDEQKRIVDKLEIFIKELDDVKARLEKTTMIKNTIFENDIQNAAKNGYSKLGEFIEERNDRVKNDWDSKRKIGVSSELGITDLRSGTKSQFGNYKIVRKYDFVYNPMRVNIGSIALYLEDEDAITSPDYVVFSIKHTLSPFFLLEFLKSRFGLREIANNTQGAVRERLYFQNLKNVNVPTFDNKDIEYLEKVLLTFNKLGIKKKPILGSVYNLQQTILQKAFSGELV